MPGAPPTFECLRLHAWLSPDACAENFTRGRYHQCVGCTVGCRHAGLDPGERESFRRKPCYRCVRAGVRQVCGLCISCYNREREVLVGINAKGDFPAIAARSLYCLTAIVAGETNKTATRRARGVAAVRLRPCLGGTVVTMLSTGTMEFERWLAWFHPKARLVNAEMLPVCVGRRPIPDRFGRDPETSVVGAAQDRQAWEVCDGQAFR